jgi:hypothetical protein
MGPKCVWAALIFFKKKRWIRLRANKGKKNETLPAITTTI